MRIRTHPGEVLREAFMKPHGLTAHRLSLLLRVPANRIGAIVKEERAVTSDTALRLARLFGTTPEFWLNLQRAHDLSRARPGRRRDRAPGRAADGRKLTRPVVVVRARDVSEGGGYQ